MCGAPSTLRPAQYTRSSIEGPTMLRVLESSQNVRGKQRSALSSVLSQAFGDNILIQEQKQSNSLIQKTKETKCDKYIDMMFYTPPDNDKYINRIVAWTTAHDEYTAAGEKKSKQFAHVEISFPFSIHNKCFEDDQTMGFSIVQHRTVSLKLKHWRPEYTAIRMYIDSCVYLKLYQTCTLLDLQKIKFDQIAMYGAVALPLHLLLSRNREVHGTYCSKIITEVLQQFKIGGQPFMQLIPCLSTPSLLYKHIKMCSNANPSST